MTISLLESHWVWKVCINITLEITTNIWFCEPTAGILPKTPLLFEIGQRSHFSSTFRFRFRNYTRINVCIQFLNSALQCSNTHNLQNIHTKQLKTRFFQCHRITTKIIYTFYNVSSQTGITASQWINMHWCCFLFCLNLHFKRLRNIQFDLLWIKTLNSIITTQLRGMKKTE